MGSLDEIQWRFSHDVSLEPKPQTLAAVSCGGFFSTGPGPFFFWVLGLDRPGFFSYYYHRQQIADGGQIPRQNRDKKTPDISVGGSRWLGLQYETEP